MDYALTQFTHTGGGACWTALLPNKPAGSEGARPKRTQEKQGRFPGMALQQREVYCPEMFGFSVPTQLAPLTHFAHLTRLTHFTLNPR